MNLLTEHGPLIETGEIDGAIYEVRGDEHPMVYVYRKGKAGYDLKVTQVGGLSALAAASMLVAELPKA